MNCELCCNDNCLDLPSLTQIQGNSYNIHRYMGYVILESMIWFDLIWLDIPNLTENNIHYGKDSFYFTADLQATSTFSFHLNSFSHFRCSCSRKSHSKIVILFGKLDKTAFPSLAERRWESSSVIVEIVVCFVLLNFRCLFDCNQFQPFSQSNREGVSSSLTNAKNHTFLSFLSRVSPIVANKQISNLFPHFSFSTILKSKRRNKTKQIQNILCKCGWDFDYFDQFDQNHAFSNHNPKRMTIDFVLRELITICEICKNEKQNE